MFSSNNNSSSNLEERLMFFDEIPLVTKWFLTAFARAIPRSGKAEGFCSELL